MRFATPVLLLACLCLLGCQRTDPEQTIKDSIAVFDQMSAALEQNNEAEALRLAAKMKAVVERAKAMKEPDTALKDKYKDELARASARLQAAGKNNPALMQKIQSGGR